MGKGDLAIKVSEWVNKNHTLVTVVPDLPEPIWSSSLIDWCELNNINYLKSGNYNDIENLDSIDLIISIFYGAIIKENFINKCKNIINLHNAPLPKYRGVRPINWALKNNETEHGVTIHKITPGIDDGPILGKLTYPIYPEIEEVIDVYKKSLEYGWLLFIDVMSKYDYIINNTIAQNNEISTYYSKKDDIKLKERSNFKRND